MCIYTHVHDSVCHHSLSYTHTCTHTAYRHNSMHTYQKPYWYAYFTCIAVSHNKLLAIGVSGRNLVYILQYRKICVQFHRCKWEGLVHECECSMLHVHAVLKDTWITHQCFWCTWPRAQNGLAHNVPGIISRQACSAQHLLLAATYIWIYACLNWHGDCICSALLEVSSIKCLWVSYELLSCFN